MDGPLPPGLCACRDGRVLCRSGQHSALFGDHRLGDDRKLLPAGADDVDQRHRLRSLQTHEPLRKAGGITGRCASPRRPDGPGGAAPASREHLHAEDGPGGRQGALPEHPL